MKINTEKMKIYNYKGIEIDNADIPYLKDKQMLYLALNSNSNYLKILMFLDESFNVINYYREYEFIKQIKSGGYGTVYAAKHVITGAEVAIKKIDTSKIGK